MRDDVEKMLDREYTLYVHVFRNHVTTSGTGYREEIKLPSAQERAKERERESGRR